ncbi:MAG: hypothetical protein EPN67_05975, partial [Pusillimonas sp.]
MPAMARLWASTCVTGALKRLCASCWERMLMPSAKSMRCRLWSVGLLLLLSLTLSDVATAQVAVSLVSAQTSVQPGQPFTVALRMQHQPHWHSFWKHAGTGLPTSITWSLSPGWSAGPIQWPTPIVLRDKQGEVSGHGYVGLLYLPMQLTPPADLQPGSSVLMRAEVHWLMCDTVCVPGHQQVSLTLPVSTQPTAVDPLVQSGIAKMSMPQSAAGWTLTANRDQSTVTLHVVAPGAGSLSELHFFPLDDFIAYKQPQTVASHANRALLKMALDHDETVPADARLRGVLAYNDAAGVYQGVTVDVPFSSGAIAMGASRDGLVVGAGSAVTLSAATGAHAAISLSFGVLLFALLGGLILNLMPCVFPVLGIKVVGFIDQAGKDRRKVAAHAWAFSGGVLLSFWMLAGLLAVLRAGGQQLGWGFQLQSAAFVFGLAVVMLMFALNLSGVFEIGGAVFDAVVPLLNVGARVPVCGLISHY